MIGSGRSCGNCLLIGAYLTQARANSVTANVGYAIGRNGELRLELRHDQATEPVFGASGLGSQNTVQIAALAWF